MVYEYRDCARTVSLLDHIVIYLRRQVGADEVAEAALADEADSHRLALA